ncbi:MAG: integrase core domain-containing protein [Pseudomonadota bacterium]
MRFIATIAALARLDADSRQIALLEPEVEPLRKRPRFEADALKSASNGSQSVMDRVGLRSRIRLDHDRAVSVDDADARRLQRYIEACVEGPHGVILPAQLPPVGTIPAPPTTKPRLRHLSANWFQSMSDARARIEDWRIDYNRNRPHSVLGGLTPTEFADQLKPAEKVA